MFCRRRRQNPLWSLILILFGLRLIKKEKHWSEEDRKAYRAKRHAFRSKLHEAFSVWDEDVEPSSTSDEN